MTLHKSITTTTSLEFSSVARSMAASGAKMISLGLGEPEFPTPPEVIDAAHVSMLAGETRYASPWGVPDLTDVLRSRIEASSGTAIEDRQIMITVGAKQALSLALSSILEPGDEVILVSPYFVSFRPQIFLAEPNVRVRELPLDAESFDLDLDRLRNMFTSRTKALILNFPNNPTGRVLGPEKMRAVALLVAESNAFLISDEIYADLLIGSNTFESFATQLPLCDRVFIVNGFSKSYSMTGWRVGYLFGPVREMERAAAVQQHLNTNVPVFVQRAALAALRLPASFLANHSAKLTTNEHVLNQALAANPLVRYNRAQAGLFAFLDISGLGVDSDRFCVGLLRSQNVATIPGKLFGSGWDDHVRVSLGLSPADFEEGVERLLDHTLSNPTGRRT